MPNLLFVTLQRETINGCTAQNYKKIESKNYKKKGTKLTTTILAQSFFDNFETHFLIILSAATQNKTNETKSTDNGLHQRADGTASGGQGRPLAVESRRPQCSHEVP